MRLSLLALFGLLALSVLCTAEYSGDDAGDNDYDVNPLPAEVERELDEEMSESGDAPLRGFLTTKLPKDKETRKAPAKPKKASKPAAKKVSRKSTKHSMKSLKKKISHKRSARKQSLKRLSAKLAKLHAMNKRNARHLARLSRKTFKGCPKRRAPKARKPRKFVRSASCTRRLRAIKKLKSKCRKYIRYTIRGRRRYFLLRRKYHALLNMGWWTRMVKGRRPSRAARRWYRKWNRTDKGFNALMRHVYGRVRAVSKKLDRAVRRHRN
eukprot:CAMPEP_0114553316 /NCGR_PEP_ID=MMETSP0114-20121206/7589_1 /TAXON_ID=31324 /ORGANISM="Goniomonas sp, Strain m" /LENGTH=266 /DNA_ID=CAMNT_0001738243 /DNA_START=17 /DNA_END=817 /DNA_ORIENTATION=-